MKKILSIFVAMIYLIKSFAEEKKIGNFIINIEIEGEKISDYFREEDFINLNKKIDDYKSKMNFKDYDIKINICRVSFKDVDVSSIKLEEKCKKFASPSLFHELTFNKIDLLGNYNFLRYNHYSDFYEKIDESKFSLQKGNYQKNKETLEKCFLSNLEINTILLSKETLSSEEIKEAREKIALIEDEEKKKKYYLLLQEKVPYHSQRDNIYSPEITCNQTSLVMCLVGLGISNPSSNLQFEDYIEELRLKELDEKIDFRTLLETRKKLLKLMGVNFSVYKNITEDFKSLKEKLLPELEKGNMITFSYGSHIVRLVKFTEDGLYVDDPYGCLYSERDLMDRKEKGENTFCRHNNHTAKDCPVNHNPNGICGTNTKDINNKNQPGKKCFWEKKSVDKLNIYNILVVKP